MIRADAKRWALGLLAGFVALPLPLNEPRPEGVVGWGFLLLYELGIGFFLLRVRRSEQEWLRPWMLNVLGLVYLPLLAIDLAALSRGQLLRPMMHLALFVLLVKLFSLVQEKDKWQALMAIFFVFVTSMATSTSPLIVLYLVGFLVLAVRALDDQVESHLRAVGVPVAAPVRRRKARLAWVLSLAGMVLAVPMFVALPRFANPFVLGRAQSANNTAAGFSDEAGLDGIGRIRDSQDVALRIESETELRPIDLRLRGATFDGFEGDHWSPSGGQDLLPRGDDGRRYQIGSGADGETVVARARVSRLPLRARALIVPSTAVEVVFEGPPTPLLRGRGGALSLVTAPRSTRIYEVALGAQPTYPRAPSPDERARLTSLEGVSDRIARLADEIVAETDGPAGEARAIEEHLTPLEESLEKSIMAARNVLKEMDYMESREKRMRVTSDSINTRVQWFSYLSIGILLVVTYGQVTYLRRYFHKKKLM